MNYLGTPLPNVILSAVFSIGFNTWANLIIVPPQNVTLLGDILTSDSDNTCVIMSHNHRVEVMGDNWQVLPKKSFSTGLFSNMSRPSHLVRRC